MHDIQGRIATGKFDLRDYDKKEITLSKFFSEYFSAVEPMKGPATIANERNYADKFLKFVGDINLRAIDQHLLDKWKGSLLGTVSPTTFNIERRSLHAALNKAVKWEYLDKNPMSSVETVKPTEHRLYLTNDEVTRLFNVIDGLIEGATSRRSRRSFQQFEWFVKFLLHTGLRRGEAIRLRPQDIDHARGQYGSIHIEQTKSKRTRTVPLTQSASEILQGLGNELFSRMNKNHASRRFAFVAREANLIGFKLHSLRHTFATNLISIGVDLYAVSRLLGHADVHTTMIYAKVNAKTLEQAILKLDGRKDICKESVMNYSLGRGAA
ncbi:MAG: tyrosine-type recombinase/integrase [Bacteroidota bacterium]